MGLIFNLGELESMKEKGLKLSPSEICEKFAHVFKTNTLAESLFYKGISDVLCGNSKFCYDLRLTDFFIKNKDMVVKEMLDMFYITEYNKEVEVDQFIFNLGNKGEMDFTLLFKKGEDVDFELLYLLSHYVYACYNIAHQTDIRKFLKPIKTSTLFVLRFVWKICIFRVFPGWVLLAILKFNGIFKHIYFLAKFKIDILF